jgi:hypothetical protein
MGCDGCGIRQRVSDMDLLLSRRDAKGGWLRLWISAYCFTIIIYGISNLIELYAELKQLRGWVPVPTPPSTSPKRTTPPGSTLGISALTPALLHGSQLGPLPPQKGGNATNAPG